MTRTKNSIDQLSLNHTGLETNHKIQPGWNQDEKPQPSSWYVSVMMYIAIVATQPKVKTMLRAGPRTQVVPKVYLRTRDTATTAGKPA